MNYCKFLLENNVKILPPKEILYEDNHFIVYTQSICQLIYSVNNLIIIKILKIIRNLLSTKIKLTDLFHKNFGIYENDVYIYDYHDYDYFYSEDKYYICHIAHLFNMYYQKDLFLGKQFDTETLKNMEFGKNVLPENITNLLTSLYDCKFDLAIENIDVCIAEFENQNKCSYSDYQYIDVDESGKLHLKKHTLEKFLVVKRALLHMPDTFTLIDYGCSLGGIGSSVAQLYPKSKIFLNNITKNELEVCKKISSESLLINVEVCDKNIVTDESSYDICLYFAILHHILKNLTFDEIINMLLRQVKQYAIIELPFANDVLLQMVMKNGSLNYEKSFAYLETLDKFKQEISKYFKIIDIIKIDYETNDLNRYAFILSREI